MTEKELKDFNAELAFDQWMSDARADLDGLEAQALPERRAGITKIWRELRLDRTRTMVTSMVFAAIGTLCLGMLTLASVRGSMWLWSGLRRCTRKKIDESWIRELQCRLFGSEGFFSRTFGFGYRYEGGWLDSFLSDTFSSVDLYAGFLMVFGLCFYVAAWSLWKRSLAHQLFARAVAWVMLGMLTINVYLTEFTNGVAGGMIFGLMALVLGGSILWLGPGAQGRDAASPHSIFRPNAFRNVLLASMMMAVGDALVLGISAIEALDHIPVNYHDRIDGTWIGRYSWRAAGHLLTDIALPLSACAGMVVCVRGLLRLKSWALFATVAMNWVVMLGCLYEVMDVGWGVLLLTFTSVIQLFLPVPVIAAVIRGRVIPRPRAERFFARAAQVAVVVLSLRVALFNLL
jgi:hypothetical protein